MAIWVFTIMQNIFLPIKSLFITYVNTKYLRFIKHFNWDLTVLNMDNVGKKADDQSLNRHKNVPNCLGQIVTGIQIIIA